MKRQTELIERLRSEESFLLIVLDACRYDAISERDERAQKVRSPASNIKQWVERVWPYNFPDGKYISGNPQARGFNNEVRVWQFDWEDGLNTTLPSAVAKSVKDVDENKMVAHFVQPHTPHLSDFDVYSVEDMRRVGAEKAKKSYEETLDYAWENGVRPLLEEYVGERKVVVTADHGEALGENNKYGHGIAEDVVLDVPWLEYDTDAEEVIDDRLKALGYK